MDLSSKAARIQELAGEINRHNHLYYNENQPEISDAQYDKLYNELAALEAETGLVMSNSPTQKVGAAVVSSLATVQHETPLLSLDKTKDVAEAAGFIGYHAAMLMLKLDGLTVKLEYKNGELFSASTRGDGHEGEDITHNARVFMDMPLTIPHKGYLCISGEAYITEKDFAFLQATIVGRDGKTYKNARNLAAGSARLLDAGECAKRRIRFGAFGVLDGKSLDGVDTNSKSAMLNRLQEFGFNIVRFHKIDAGKNNGILFTVTQLQNYAKEAGIPIDGIVITYDDVAYSKSLGRTGHHYHDGLALKFEDDTIETVLRKVEWNVSRSGALSPVAVFDAVDLDGTEVTRASLHNPGFIENLNLKLGDRITVSKRNMIIPHVESNLNADKPKDPAAPSIMPDKCPCCGGTVSIVPNEDGDAVLYCTNNECFDRILRQFEHFASKKAMDIGGLSQQTLKRLLEAGLIKTKADLYTLQDHKSAIVRMEGFGEKAFSKLIEAIEKSRNTTMERFIISMDIPMLGRHASAILCKAFDYDLERIRLAGTSDFDFTVLDDFGGTLHQNIREWFSSEENLRFWEHIAGLMIFKSARPQPAAIADNPFAGKTIVATGSFETFTRDSINSQIEALVAKAGSSVSKKTDFVVVGKNAGSKRDKAESLGIPTLTEAEFRNMAGL